MSDPVHDSNRNNPSPNESGPNEPMPSRGLMVLGVVLVVMALLGMLEQTIEQLQAAPPDESLESAASLMVTMVVCLTGVIWLFSRHRSS